MTFAFALLCGCKDNEEGTLNVGIDLSKIEFVATEGGAIVRYTLPDNKSVYGIRVTYTNALGQTEEVVGTYGGKELMLGGFFEAESSIPAEIALIGFDRSVSKTTRTTFSTLKAATLSIFDNIRVASHWSGFSVSYTAPTNTRGFINVGYHGVNPTTNRKGLIYKGSTLIKPGENKLLYVDIPVENGEIDIEVWTEDFAGNEVFRKSFQATPFNMVKYDSSLITYTGSSMENALFGIGWQYLFDGDSKGLGPVRDGNYISARVFATANPVSSQPEGILDLGSPQYLAAFRLYTILNSNLNPGVGWNTVRASSMANHFILYASNDQADWVEVGEFYQNPAIAQPLWWCYPTIDPLAKLTNVAEVEEADPAYAEVPFDVMDTPYQYLKIKFMSAFALPSFGSANIGASEMEVYVKE